MLELPDVTLLTVTSTKYAYGANRALKLSSKNIRFGNVIYISDECPRFLHKGFTFKRMSKFQTIDDFNHFMVYELYNYVDTDYALIVHYDGFVVNPESWKDEFLDYDYIGSPWPMPSKNDKVSYRDIHGNICRVGNSVSIRSKRLMQLPSELNIPWQKYGGWYNEDGFICVNNRHIFEEHGMKIAPLELAVYFGHEIMIPEINGIKPFVFHKWAGTNRRYPNKLYAKVVWERERIKKALARRSAMKSQGGG